MTPAQPDGPPEPDADGAGVRIAIVVAAARNGVIGRDGVMPWHMPGDLKTFRRLTLGHPIVMGRKTFQAIGRALDQRLNIVISRDPDFAANGVVAVTTFEAALETARRHCAAGKAKNCRVMVIGGGEIYRLALTVADTVYLTEIDTEVEGDTYFPALDPAQWLETEREALTADARDEYNAELVTFERAPKA